MNILTGLFPNMVMQRDSRDVSDSFVSGTCDSEGAFIATVWRNKKPIKGFKDKPIGRAKGSAFAFRIKGVPAGGPYDVSLKITDKKGTVRDSILIKNVLVGDVWILAGQSNMEGLGYLKHAPKPVPMVRAFYMDDTWGIAREPLHEKEKAVDPVHAAIDGGRSRPKAAHIGTGPGTAFAQTLYRKTGIPQGLLVCAHGGTSMSQWDPGLKDKGGHSLYGATLRRLTRNGGRAAGLFWYQGCSETYEEAAGLYTVRMQTLIDSFRRDCGNPGLPAVVVQISQVAGNLQNSRWWNAIRELQRKLPESIKHLAVVPAIDLSLDDGIHINGEDQNRLGRRSAEAMLSLTGRDRKLPLPIELGKVSVVKNGYGVTCIEVAFKNVAGRLVSSGRPAGFELSESVEKLTNQYIWRVELDGSKAILKTGLNQIMSGSLSLYYGFGTMPYCNVTDGADRSLPAFGPVRITSGRAILPFIRKMRVSGFLACPDDFASLAYPADKASLQFRPREFQANFCELHNEFVKEAPKNLLVHYAFTVRCREPMQLKLWLGYDGPVKVWIDERELHSDPKGTNPALADDAKIPFSASAGEHEVIVALGSNFGMAWGIFATVERTDIEAERIKTGETASLMPEIS